MNLTRLVNIYQNPCEVYIGRPSIFGNPFIVGKDGPLLEVIDKFRVYFYDRITTDAEFATSVKALKGKILGCHCTPKPCHGNVYVYYLDFET